MSVPIFSSGMRHSRLSQARIDLEKARNTKSQVEQSLLLGVSQAKSQYITALQNYMRDKNSVDLALKIYHKTTVKYEEGIVSSVELTQQHNQFLSTESKYFQTILSLLNAKNKLDKALGNY
jgi:outer membrane protein TolC